MSTLVANKSDCQIRVKIESKVDSSSGQENVEDGFVKITSGGYYPFFYWDNVEQVVTIYSSNPKHSDVAKKVRVEPGKDLIVNAKHCIEITTFEKDKDGNMANLI